MLLAKEYTNSGVHFDLEKLKQEVNDFTLETEKENFWSNRSQALEIINKLNHSKNIIDTYTKLSIDYKDLCELLDLEDESLFEQIEASIVTLKNDSHEFELEILFTGEFDNLNAIVDIHPGAGGTEAQDWADMLYRMYVMYAQNHKMKMQLISYEPADDAGLKSVSVKICGHNAYGLFKGEKGVHRLVRISPFDANKRRHTSFASVYVYPVLDDTIEVDIRPEDLRVDTYRAGGKGGQHVNKTDSAVRFTHIPTGIVVACQSERSQIMNRQSCMNMLKARLYEYYREQKEKENSKFAAEKKDISFGSQIRSYVFCPYTMVKDHRTKFSVGNIQGVMDGDIDEFMMDIDSHMSMKDDLYFELKDTDANIIYGPHYQKYKERYGIYMNFR